LYTHILSASLTDASASGELATVANQPESDARTSRLKTAKRMLVAQNSYTFQTGTDGGCHQSQSHLHTASRRFASAPSPRSPVGDQTMSTAQHHNITLDFLFCTSFL